jgi:hypothetical protein
VREISLSGKKFNALTDLGGIHVHLRRYGQIMLTRSENIVGNRVQAHGEFARFVVA